MNVKAPEDGAPRIARRNTDRSAQSRSLQHGGAYIMVSVCLHAAGVGVVALTAFRGQDAEEEARAQMPLAVRLSEPTYERFAWEPAPELPEAIEPAPADPDAAFASPREPDPIVRLEPIRAEEPRPPSERLDPSILARPLARPPEPERSPEAATVFFPPSYERNPPIPYPAAARRAGLEGLVVLRVAVVADGSVRSVSVVESSGHVALDDAAADAVRGWRFTPARRGETAVESTVDVPVRFRLRE